MKIFENIFFIIILIFIKNVVTLNEIQQSKNKSGFAENINSKIIPRKLLIKNPKENKIIDIKTNPQKKIEDESEKKLEKRNLSIENIDLKSQILDIIQRTNKKLIICENSEKKQENEKENISCKYKDHTIAVKIVEKDNSKFNVVFYEHGNSDFYNNNDVLDISDLKLLEINSENFFMNQLKYFKLHRNILKKLFEKVDYLFCKKRFQKTVCKYDDFNLALVIRYFSVSEKFFITNFYQYGKQKRTTTLKIKSKKDLKKFSKKTEKFFKSQTEVFEIHKKIIQMLYKKNSNLKCNGSVIRTICYYDDTTKGFLINNEIGSFFKIYIYNKGLETLGSTLEISKISQISEFEQNLDHFLSKQNNFFLLYKNLIKKIIDSSRYFICDGNSVRSHCTYNGRDKAFSVVNLHGDFLEIDFFEYGTNEVFKSWRINNFDSLREFNGELERLLEKQVERLGDGFFLQRKAVI